MTTGRNLLLSLQHKLMKNKNPAVTTSTGSPSDVRHEGHRQPDASLRADGVRESKPPSVRVCGEHPPGWSQVGSVAELHDWLSAPLNQQLNSPLARSRASIGALQGFRDYLIFLLDK